MCFKVFMCFACGDINNIKLLEPIHKCCWKLWHLQWLHIMLVSVATWCYTTQGLTSMFTQLMSLYQNIPPLYITSGWIFNCILKIHLRIQLWILQCPFQNHAVHLREHSRRLKFCCDTGAHISFYCNMCQRLPASVLSFIFQKNKAL